MVPPAVCGHAFKSAMAYEQTEPRFEFDEPLLPQRDASSSVGAQILPVYKAERRRCDDRRPGLSEDLSPSYTVLRILGMKRVN